MLTSLRLQNFRRLEALELIFDPDDQLIVVDGPNGVGKSTIFEAILYALTGETRHGREGVSGLVRRGAELEGMQVELTFHAAGTDYRVVRRRDGVSSAVLYGNEVALIEGPREVSAAIAAALGMDATGLKLACLAKQGELDGLASETPSRRAAAVGRLLRLDAVARARDEAGAVYRRHSDVVREMGAGRDLTGLRAEVTSLEELVDGYTAARDDAQARVTALDAQLAADGDLARRWTHAQETFARAQGAAEAAAAELGRAEAAEAAVIVPPAPAEAGRSADAVDADLSALDRNIAVGEELARTAEHRRAITEERDLAAARLDELGRILAETGEPDEAVEREAQARVAVDRATTEERRREETLTERRAAVAAAAARLDDARARVEAVGRLGAVCETCGQEVDDTHRHDMAARARETVAGRQDELRAAIQAEGESARLYAAAQRAVADGAAALTEAQAQTRAAREAARERPELQRRIATYERQLHRPAADTDLSALYEERGRLSAELAGARRREEQQRDHDRAAAMRQAAASTVAEARSRLAEARRREDDSRPDGALRDAWDAHQGRVAERGAEAELVNGLEVELAGATERLTAARQRVADATTWYEARAVRVRRAEVAGRARAVLAEVHATLATELRPALEATIADLLGRMSEGRFTSVRVSDDYEVAVLDDGDYRPLAELSGGEHDLVALAVRLALAQVASDGHTGIGFLVLDEVLGSQDSARRDSVMRALRALRDTYGQIFAISHVGGIDDYADRVVRLTTSPDRTVTNVTVT